MALFVGIALGESHHSYRTRGKGGNKSHGGGGKKSHEFGGGGGGGNGSHGFRGLGIIKVGANLIGGLLGGIGGLFQTKSHSKNPEEQRERDRKEEKRDQLIEQIQKNQILIQNTLNQSIQNNKMSPCGRPCGQPCSQPCGQTPPQNGQDIYEIYDLYPEDDTSRTSTQGKNLSEVIKKTDQKKPADQKPSELQARKKNVKGRKKKETGKKKPQERPSQDQDPDREKGSSFRAGHAVRDRPFLLKPRAKTTITQDKNKAPLALQDLAEMASRVRDQDSKLELEIDLQD